MENNTEIKSQSSHNKDHKIKAAIATSTIVAGLGGGIGIGYAI
jgi:hypothetical protein